MVVVARRRRLAIGVANEAALARKRIELKRDLYELS